MPCMHLDGFCVVIIKISFKVWCIESEGGSAVDATDNENLVKNVDQGNMNSFGSIGLH